MGIAFYVSGSDLADMEAERIIRSRSILPFFIPNKASWRCSTR